MVEYRISPPVTDDQLNALMAESWPGRRLQDFQPVLARSIAYICGFEGERLIGFVNLAWDGGVHAFLLDTVVHPEMRRRGIGVELVRHAVAAVRGRGLEWIHVDSSRELEPFYARCGFLSADYAGLMRMDGGR